MVKIWMALLSFRFFGVEDCGAKCSVKCSVKLPDLEWLEHCLQ